METIEKSLIRSLRSPFNRATAYRELEKFHAQERSLEDIVRYAMKFPSTGYYRIDSIQIRDEFLSLVKEVAALKPAVVLEIGTARGGTLFAWSQIASELVISCDLHSPQHKAQFYKDLPPPNSSCKVINLHGDSHKAEFKRQVETELAGRKVDFLFIDGDHTEAGVEQDFNDYKEFVRPGGIIAFHDIVEKQPVPTNQVYYFWTRIKDNYTHREYVKDQQQSGFGIGVLEAEGA